MRRISWEDGQYWKERELVMIIDTSTKATLEETLCDCLSTTPNELKIKVENFYNESYAGKFVDHDIFLNKVENYITKSGHKKIDKLQFYHLTRRLKEMDDFETKNLKSLLTDDNAFSRFLGKYNISFKCNTDYIEMYRDGEIVELASIDAFGSTEYCYLRRRLGYARNVKDFCVNGLAFKFNMSECGYYNDLNACPEFISMLSQYLKSPIMKNDFKNNSGYHCYQYNFPIERIIFDGQDSLPENQKEIYFLITVIENWFYAKSGDEPLILRLSDDDTAAEEFFVQKNSIEK